MLLFSLLTLLLLHLTDAKLFVKTSYGTVRGARMTAKNGHPVEVFKGVPFASPPIGDLRWSFPRPPQPWKGFKETTKYAPACMSRSYTSNNVTSEDCLYLNIFKSIFCTPESPCPIIVYMHGGEMVYDSNMYDNYAFLVDAFPARGLIFVTVSFRLGSFANIDLGDDQNLAPTNLGMADVIESLRFLKQEGHSFGGDASRIVLFGHSYGAVLSLSVAYSPVQQRDVGISRVIAFAPQLFYLPDRLLRFDTETLVKGAACERATPEETLHCLRALTADELLDAQETYNARSADAVHSFTYNTFKAPFLPFKGVQDMLDHPPKGTSLLVGTTRREHDYEDTRVGPIPPKIPYTEFVLLEDRAWPELWALYQKEIAEGTMDNHKDGSVIAFVSTFEVARSFAKGGNKAFVYSMDQDPRTFHLDELVAYLGWKGAMNYNYTTGSDDKIVAKFYPRLLVNFTRFGDPSPLWKPFSLDNEDYFSIYVNKSIGKWPETLPHYQKKIVDFWVKGIQKMDDNLKSSVKAPGIRELLTEVKPAANADDLIAGVLFIGIIAMAAIGLVNLLTRRRIAAKQDEYQALLD